MEVFHMMKTIAAFAALAVVAGGMAGCQTVPKEQTVAQYCQDPKHAEKDVCKLMVEIDGQKTALSQTNMTLTQARAVADDALSQAKVAQAAAAKAQSTADEALVKADVNCTTKTVARSKTGSCDAGYKLVSCNQTHYTTRSGGTSILREISDSQCRFQDKVLEMQVRCCVSGPLPPQTDAALPATPEKPAAPSSSSSS